MQNTTHPGPWGRRCRNWFLIHIGRECRSSLVACISNLVFRACAPVRYSAQARDTLYVFFSRTTFFLHEIRDKNDVSLSHRYQFFLRLSHGEREGEC